MAKRKRKPAFDGPVGGTFISQDDIRQAEEAMAKLDDLYAAMTPGAREYFLIVTGSANPIHRSLAKHLGLALNARDAAKANSDRKTLRQDPKIVEIVRSEITKKSTGEIAKQLNDGGYRNMRGGAFTRDAIKQMVARFKNES